MVLGLCLHGQDVAAQPPAAQPAPAIEPAKPTWERLIYLPYKNLKSVFFDNEKSAVFMPYGEFLKMWGAYKPEAAEAKPPVSAVITQANYSGTVEQDQARLKVEYTIQVLGKPWVELPLQFGEAAIGKITSPDNKVLLQATGNGSYVLLFPTAGEQKIQLELVTRVHTSPDGRSFELSCPAAGVATLDLVVPAADQTIELPGTGGSAAGVTVPVMDDAKVTHIQAQLGATQKIAARWRPRVSAAPVMELLAGVENVTNVRISDGLVHTQATLTYQVQRGQLDQLRIAVPLNHRVLDVVTSGLKAWKAVPEEKQQLLTVDLLSSDAKTIQVDVHTEYPMPTDPFDVAGIAEDGVAHGIHAIGGVREHGLVLLSHANDLTLSVEQQSGITRVEAGEVAEALRRPETQFYKFYTPKFTLRSRAKPVEPRVLAQQQTQLMFGDDELQLKATLEYTVERAGVFELRLKLPEGLVVDRVDCDSMKEFQAPAGANLLIVSLREKRQGTIQLQVAAHRVLDPATPAMKLPVLEPLAVERETGSLSVYAPEALEIVTDEKTLQGLQPDRLQGGNQANVGAGMRLASSWTYTRRPVEISVTTTRKPTRLSATVGTIVNVGQSVIEVETRLTYQVEYAGIDTFRFAVPASVADLLQIESGDPVHMPIKQKNRAEPENEWVTWTIVMQRELTGAVPLKLKYDLKPERQQTTSAFSVKPVRVLSSPGKSGEIPIPAIKGEFTVLKDRSLSVTSTADAVLEAIDVRDLQALPQDGSLAYRYFSQPAQLADSFGVNLTATLHETQEVEKTVVSRQTLEAVITEEASIMYRCRYLVKTSERQRLPLDLPDPADLLDVLVAGRKVDIEVDPAGKSGTWKSFFVNVARTTNSDEAFVIALVYRAPLKGPPLAGRTGGNADLKFPRLGGATSVPVMELRTAVWVPEDYVLVGAPENFKPLRQTRLSMSNGAVGYTTDSADLESWFGNSTGGLFEFSTAGRVYQYHKLGTAEEVEVTYWPVATNTWIISGAALLIALLFVWTTWDNRLTLVLAAAFAAVLWATKDLDQVMNAIAAARWGLMAGLALWILSSLARIRPRPTPPPTQPPVQPVAVTPTPA